MPAIKYDDFELPTGLKNSKDTAEMTNKTFTALIDWFAGIINPIETEWQRGGSDGASRTNTEFRLGGLASEVNSIKDQLMDFVNDEMRLQKPLAIDNFKLPPDATVDGPHKSPVMMAKAFQALTPWFKSIMAVLKPYFLAAAKNTPDKEQFFYRLAKLKGQASQMKIYILRYVNKQIQMKEAGRISLSEQPEATVPDAAVANILQIFDVDVGESLPIDVDSVDPGEVIFEPEDM